MRYIAIFELLGVEKYEISIRLSKNISIPGYFRQERTICDLKQRARIEKKLTRMFVKASIEY